jgi:hypothetical protein
MVIDRPIERMTLRELLTHASKLTHDVSEKANTTLQTRLADLHELSRPTRRKTQYPSVVSLQNAIHRYSESARELRALIASLEEHLHAIREQANRARFERR